MKLKRIIIHELKKEANTTKVDYRSSDSLIDVNEDVESLIQEIHNAFERSITQYSKFDITQIHNAVFLNSKKYIATPSDDNFITFSKASLSDLASRIEREPFATGGYYAFVDYEINGYQFITIVILRDKEAFNIKWKKNKFSVDPTENINIDKLAMGFRLNCNLYSISGDRNYIGLVSSNQGDNLSKYFVKWVNATDVITGHVNTNSLVNVIKDLGPVDSETTKEEFERFVYDWISAYKKDNSRSVDVDKLSEHLYGDPLTIRNYASSQHGKEIDPIFRVYVSELKRLIRLRATAKGISVSIDVEKFNEDEVQLTSNALIIKNQTIINSLKTQISIENE